MINILKKIIRKHSMLITSVFSKFQCDFSSDVPADGVIPNAKDFCASLLHGYALHMIHRIHRAFAFCEKENLLTSSQRSMVFSGGVACNAYIRTAIEHSCVNHLNCKFFAPPPRLCTDNGVMIAWYVF